MTIWWLFRGFIARGIPGSICRIWGWGCSPFGFLLIWLWLGAGNSAGLTVLRSGRIMMCGIACAFFIICTGRCTFMLSCGLGSPSVVLLDAKNGIYFSIVIRIFSKIIRDPFLSKAMILCVKVISYQSFSFWIVFIINKKSYKWYYLY